MAEQSSRFRDSVSYTAAMEVSAAPFAMAVKHSSVVLKVFRDTTAVELPFWVNALSPAAACMRRAPSRSTSFERCSASAGVSGRSWRQWKALVEVSSPVSYRPAPIWVRKVRIADVGRG